MTRFWGEDKVVTALRTKWQNVPTEPGVVVPRLITGRTGRGLGEVGKGLGA